MTHRVREFQGNCFEGTEPGTGFQRSKSTLNEKSERALLSTLIVSQTNRTFWYLPR